MLSFHQFNCFNSIQVCWAHMVGLSPQHNSLFLNSKWFLLFVCSQALLLLFYVQRALLLPFIFTESITPPILCSRRALLLPFYVHGEHYSHFMFTKSITPPILCSQRALLLPFYVHREHYSSHLMFTESITPPILCSQRALLLPFYVCREHYSSHFMFTESITPPILCSQGALLLPFYVRREHYSSNLMFTGSSVATIFGPLANNLFGPLAKGLRQLLLPGGPLQPRRSPRGQPRGSPTVAEPAGPLLRHCSQGAWPFSKFAVWFEINSAQFHYCFVFFSGQVDFSPSQEELATMVNNIAVLLANCLQDFQRLPDLLTKKKSTKEVRPKKKLIWFHSLQYW